MDYALSLQNIKILHCGMQENMHYYSNSLLFPGTYRAIAQLSFTLQLRSPNPKSVYVSLTPPQAQREWLVSYSGRARGVKSCSH